MTYDSAADTLAHSRRVGELLLAGPIAELRDRAATHDLSKLDPPEKAMYDEMVPRLQAAEFGTDEYRAALDAMGPGLAHHYAHNRHHPEHFPDGIAGMTLVDLLEMLADWQAAAERRGDTLTPSSLAVQAQRFGISEQLLAILAETAEHHGWLSP